MIASVSTLCIFKGQFFRDISVAIEVPSSVRYDVLKELSILLSVLYLAFLIAAFTMGVARGTDVGGPALQVSHTIN